MNDRQPPRVLLATDDSESARDAETWLRRAAWAVRPSVDVACIGDAGEARLGWWTDVGSAGARLGEELRHAELLAAEQVANSVAERLQHEGFVTRSWASQGESAEELVELAAHLEPDLVVVGSRGRSRLGRLLLGSVSATLVRAAHQPVLVVRHLPEVADRLPGGIVIAAATDAELEHLISWLGAIGFLHNARLSIVGLGGGSRGLTEGGPPTEGGDEAAERMASIAGRRVEALGAAPRSLKAHLASAHPVEAVIQAGEAIDADLLVVARQPAERNQKTTAEQVAEHAQLAALVIPFPGR
jgi:nucleotide-binding universal stress UspA family protein